MANRTNADSRQHLTVDSPPPMISKGIQGSDSYVPLSPQWLLPKPGENNLGVMTGDSLFSPRAGSRPDAAKTSGNSEDLHDTESRTEVFKSSIYDTEPGKHDRWRDEERETNSAIRRDRWREVDRELGDTRRTERWTDNNSSRHSGEPRRAPSDRWNDGGNRESNLDQRRESKWNTRWGPDDKEPENRREKWSDSGRDSDGSRDKAPQLTNHGREINNHAKEDREGEHPRSWRSNSFLARGRGEASQQLSTPNKQVSVFPYGRGRGENGTIVFPAGRGRVNSSMSNVNSGLSHSHSLGVVSDKFDNVHGEPSTIKYSRMKLLDIYRTSDIKSYIVSLEGFIEVPSLTLAEPLEPLALSAPTLEELVVLKGIDKGDVVSSGLPQVSKDGSVGKNSIDSMSKQTKLGNREDQSFLMGDYKDDNRLNQFEDGNVTSNKNLPSYREDRSNAEALRLEGILKKGDEGGSRETSGLENLSPHHTIPWRSQSAAERSHGSSHSSHDFPTEVRSKKSDMGWSYLHKEVETERKNTTAVSTPYNKDESLWQQRTDELHSELKMDPTIRRQPSGIFAQQREGNSMYSQEDHSISRDTSRKFQPTPSPEDLSLYYKDPQGRIQGPFSGSDLIGWFESGYFGIDLQVRLTSAPFDTPFSSLGDVMPHLRMKARPPPGFSMTKQNDAVEISSGGKFGGIGNTNVNLAEYELKKNGHTIRHEGPTESENRFLESLMSGNVSSSPPQHFPSIEGTKAYGSGGSGGMPLVGGESGGDINYLLAQRMSLDRHRSQPNTLSQWPGRDPASIGSMTDHIPQSLALHSKLLPPAGDPSHQISHNSQQVDLLSILQAAAGNMDMHQSQHVTPQTGFGVPQQRMHPQNQSPLSHIMTQHGEVSSLIPPEMLLSADISKDPQILNLLQQQYLLSQLQLQSQSPFSTQLSQPPHPTQLSLLDKILLLKQQQQKQEQHHQLLLQQQQQQHLLAQVLSGQQSHQHVAEPSYGHLKGTIPPGNTPMDHLGFHHPHEALQINQQMSNLNLIDGRASNISNLTLQGSQDVSSAPSSLPLPHQIFDHAAYSSKLGGTHPLDVGRVPDSYSIPTVVADSLFPSEAMEKSAQEVFLSQENVIGSDQDAAQLKPLVLQPSVTPTSSVFEAVGSLVFSEESAGNSDLMFTNPEQIDEIKVSLENIPETYHTESPSVVGVKDVEVREKKASDKKSRRQRTSKIQPNSDAGKGLLKTVVHEQPKTDFEIDGGKSGVTKSEVQESLDVTPSMGAGSDYSVITAAESPKSQQTWPLLSTVMPTNVVEIIDRLGEHGEVGTLTSNSQTTSSHRSWRPAPGVKPKSLKEIQQEEQRRTQTERLTSETASILTPTNTSPAPWVGLATTEHKYDKDAVHSLASGQFVLGEPANPMSSKSRKSHLHDLLAEEVLAKSDEGDNPTSNTKSSPLPPFSPLGAQIDRSAVGDDDFVEAKDTKKSRKKAAKTKSAGLKASSPVDSADLSAPPISIEKGKSARELSQQDEILPVPPAGPSLGDFVFWKGDQANSVPGPAWSVDSGVGKSSKTKSLRDIQREQERKTASMQQRIPIPAPVKVQSNHDSHKSGSSWQAPGSSPSQASSPILTKAAPIQTSPLTSIRSKSRVEDDLFWGPLHQSKQETKQSQFPLLANSSSGVKVSTGKATPVAAVPNRQKPQSSRPADSAISSSPSANSSLPKGKDPKSKLSEAMDFRDWCERELVRLTGANDTSFLEFCLKQSTSEAEMLLRENLGSMDRNHEFIDKFLNYKDFLSLDVMEIAFRPRSSLTAGSEGLGNNGPGGTRDAGDGDSGGGGKKKVKKGKKVSLADLGFSVVSNRIMMGEIQTVEE